MAKPATAFESQITYDRDVVIPKNGFFTVRTKRRGGNDLTALFPAKQTDI